VVQRICSITVLAVKPILDPVQFRVGHRQGTLQETFSCESLWNFLTLLRGLLTVQEVAREFESSSLRRAGHCEPYSPWN